jgi:hypothetical protein
MRLIGLRLLAAVTVAAASLAVIAPASARPRVVDSVDSSYLDRGVKKSSRTFAGHGDGNPPISVKDGAEVNADGTYRFPITGGTYVPRTDAASIRLGGSVVFSYPSHGFVITLADPALVVNGTTITWTGLAATLKPAGSEAFAGVYPAGTAMDPVAGTVTTGGR